MSDLTAVSLFAGIGGFDLALHHAGVHVAAAVEIDPACRGVLRRHFPQTAVFSDVTEVTGEQLRAAGFVPERGVITGGFPCQDLSVAGRRAGLAGARSGLFWEIMRLADELSPRWLLLENVPGLLSAVCPCPGGGACAANGRAVRCGEWRPERIPGPADDIEGDACPVCGHDWGYHDAGGFCATCSDTCQGLPKVKVRKVFVSGVPHGIRGGACPGGCMPAHGGAMGTVLGALGQRGYGFAYRVLDAQFFGVPQRRRRVFVAAGLGDPAGPVQVLLGPDGGEGHPAAGRQARAHAPEGTGSEPGVPRVTGTLTAGSLAEYDDNTARAAFMVTAATIQGGGRRGHRIDAEGAAGGHLVPVTAYALTSSQTRQDGTVETLIAHPVTSREARRSPDSDATNGLIVTPVALRSRDGGGQIEAGDPGDPAFTVRTPGGGSSYPMIAHALTSEGADASEDGTGRGTPLVAVSLTAGTAAGDGVRPPGRRREDDTNLPQSGGTKARLGYGETPTALQANQVTAVQTATAVRRLTPTECERLQGFPDDWTRWLDDGTEQSDSARYRQCGNAVAVPVVEWIAHRIVAVDEATAERGAA